MVDVEPDSPADKAGLEEGDLMIDLHGHPVRSIDDFQRLLTDERVGVKVPVRVLRRPEILNLHIVPAESSPAPGGAGVRRGSASNKPDAQAKEHLIIKCSFACASGSLSIFIARAGHNPKSGGVDVRVTPARHRISSGGSGVRPWSPVVPIQT